MMGDMAKPMSRLNEGWEDRNEGVVTMTIASKIVRRVATIDENKTVLDAAKLMTEEFIGSVVVTNSSGIRGLFTERELMMNVVGKGKDPETVPIKQVMTHEPITVSPNDSAGACLDLMKEHRCRHLLVFEEDEFVGIVSLRDMVALMIDEKEELIQQLETYITS
jgi:CBS domain-containing protein